MKNLREDGISALMMGEFKNDRVLLHEIFGEAGWRLLEAHDRRHALDFLEKNRLQVVIAETQGRGWTWKSLLSDLRRFAEPPQLVVTSPLADEGLWSEVLNLGAYDLLAQPLVRDEVERVIGAARRQFAKPPSRVIGRAVLAAPA